MIYFHEFQINYNNNIEVIYCNIQILIKTKKKTDQTLVAIPKQFLIHIVFPLKTTKTNQCLKRMYRLSLSLRAEQINLSLFSKCRSSTQSKQGNIPMTIISLDIENTNMYVTYHPAIKQKNERKEKKHRSHYNHHYSQID